jgi:PAS domain S-box-containing protein
MPVREDGGQNVRSLAFFETLFESSADALLALDGATILDGNRTAEVVFGRQKKEIIGRTVLDLSPEFQPGGQKSKEMAEGLFSAALAGEPQFFEWMHLRADGTPFPTEISLTRFLVGGNVYLQASIRDITLRKLDEDELREALPPDTSQLPTRKSSASSSTHGACRDASRCSRKPGPRNYSRWLV